jgi:hypothetical protein
MATALPMPESAPVTSQVRVPHFVGAAGEMSFRSLSFFSSRAGILHRRHRRDLVCMFESFHALLHGHTFVAPDAPFITGTVTSGLVRKETPLIRRAFLPEKLRCSDRGRSKD